MADLLLLPGFGGTYTSETFTAASGVGADTFDCSHLNAMAFQINSDTSPAGNIDIEETFNGLDWGVRVADMAVADATITRLDTTDGPFGRMRINATDITAGNVTVTVVGFSDHRH